MLLDLSTFKQSFCNDPCEIIISISGHLVQGFKRVGSLKRVRITDSFKSP
jgi:hypothetical protein